MFEQHLGWVEKESNDTGSRLSRLMVAKREEDKNISLGLEIGLILVGVGLMAVMRAPSVIVGLGLVLQGFRIKARVALGGPMDGIAEAVDDVAKVRDSLRVQAG